MWIVLALIAAVFLGIYDVFKKVSVNDNAVLPVLFFSSCAAALACMPIIVGSQYAPAFFKSANLYAPELTAKEHLMVLFKSALVVSSWVFAFFGLKHLPVTIASPIRATGPIWTLFGAIIIFDERLNLIQWSGVVTTLFFFYLFSTTGKLEGIRFKTNKWVWFIVAATLLGAVSGLYDKHIIRAVDRIAVQAWFSVYQVAVLGPVLLIFWIPRRHKLTPFKWRWSIPFIGITLLFSDFFYFYSISEPDALISILSGIRRGGVAVAFTVGAILFHEKNIKIKALYLGGILLGVALLSIGSH